MRGNSSSVYRVTDLHFEHHRSLTQAQRQPGSRMEALITLGIAWRQTSDIRDTPTKKKAANDVISAQKIGNAIPIRERRQGIDRVQLQIASDNRYQLLQGVSTRLGTQFSDAGQSTLPLVCHWNKSVLCYLRISTSIIAAGARCCREISMRIAAPSLLQCKGNSFYGQTCHRHLGYLGTILTTI